MPSTGKLVKLTKATNNVVAQKHAHKHTHSTYLLVVEQGLRLHQTIDDTVDGCE